MVNVIANSFDQRESEASPPPRLMAAAYGRLRSMLFSGAIRAGSVIQERRLAEQLGLSRTPVRDALGRLEGEGFLQRDGRYLMAAIVTVEEVMDILAVRRSLETDAVRRACGRIPGAQIAVIRKAILRMNSRETVSDEEHWATDDLLHLTVAEASGNRLLARLVRELRERTRMFGLNMIPTRFDAGKAEHIAILDALASGDANVAAARMQQHIDNARDGILQTLSRRERQ